MRKPDLYGIIGSTIFCGLLLLLLFLITIPSHQTAEEEGVVVSFGNFPEGTGHIAKVTNEIPQPQKEEQLPTTPAVPKSSTEEQEKQDLLTQEEESLALAKEQEKEQKRKEKEELERKKREEEKRIAEQKRIEEERRLAEEKRIAEEKRKQQEAIERATALGNKFGESENMQGSGTSSGEEHQGNPVGKGVSEGNSWSLSGRSLVGKLLLPSYNKNIEGVITINIRVNENGEVVSASIGTPTTITDNEIRKATQDAAKKTRFSAGKSISTGTINYNFKLR